MAVTAPQVGDLAPDFSLPSTGGGHVTLADFRGEANVLLAFFPLAFTGTCTAQLCAFTEDRGAFASKDTRVFGISVDSLPTLNEFRKRYEIQVDLLSDFKREVSRQYGTLNEHLFFSERAYFIVGKDGIIQWKYFEDDLGDRRENAELLAELERVLMV